MFSISSKKLFSFLRPSIFVFLSSPLFFPVDHFFRGWSKINLNVYDVINCLNKSFLFDILRRKKRMTLKLHQLIKYWIRNIFMEKLCRKCAPKASPRPLFNFGNRPNQNSHCMQENFFKNKIFWKGIIKKPWKS